MPKDNRTCLATGSPAPYRFAIDVGLNDLSARNRRALHPGALYSFAAKLPVDARLVLAFSMPFGSARHLRLSAWLEGLPVPASHESHAADLPRALRIAFAGSNVAPMDNDHDGFPVATRLLLPRYDHANYLSAAGVPEVGSVPKLATIPAPPEDTVLLPAPMARPAPLAAILQILAKANQHGRLIVSLAPVRLQAFALRQIAATAEQIEGVLCDPLTPFFAQMRLSKAREVLRGWQDFPDGVSAELGLETDAPLPDWLVDSLCTAVHGHHAPGHASRNGGGIDLSLAWSQAEAPRITFPGQVALNRLALLTTAAPAAADGVVIGKNGIGQPVALSDRLRGQHLYLCGATGTGKSSLIRRMVRDDVRRGFGVAVIEPHGDLIDDLRRDLEAKDGPGRLHLADLSQAQSGFSLNLLENDGLAPGQHANFVANQLIMAFTRILYRDVPEAFGPMFASYFRNALMLLMLGSKGQAHLGDFDRVFTDRPFRKELLERCPDEHVRRFWIGIAQRVTHGEASLESIAPYIVSKLTMFVGNPLLRPILCTPGSSVDFHGIMQRGDVLLANLAKGVTGETDSRLMGALLTTKIFAAAMRRGQLPREERRPFRIYLDEFHSFGTDLIGDMLAEGRKFGLELTLANQSISQIDGRNRGDDIAHAILANCGTVLAFRTSPLGAPLMAGWIGDGVGADDLVKLPNYEVVGRLPDGNGTPLTRRFQTFPDSNETCEGRSQLG